MQRRMGAGGWAAIFRNVRICRPHTGDQAIFPAIYAEIEKSLAGIQKALRQDPKQGQQVVKFKRNLWHRADADTFSGYMDKMGGRLESKFVHETADLCRRALASILELDLRLLGEFLKRHGVKAQKLDHEARAACYEKIIANDLGDKPRFYNLHRNLLALIVELEKAD